MKYLMMKPEEIKKAHLIECAINGLCTVKEVATALHLSERRVKQIKREVKLNGVQSIIHGNRDRKPKHTITEEIKTEIIQLREKYNYEISNFKHFQELLLEHENIEISYSSLHRILVNAGFKSPKKHRKKKLHHRRKRKSALGIMLQADGTPFQWFGGNKMYSLHGFIDDATGIVTGLYMCEHECLLGYLEVLRQTLLNYGIPLSLYPDKYSVFFPSKSEKDHVTIEEQLNGQDKCITQFGRIVDELGIDMFPASCSQAKGRVERLWETLQSRLVTEFRIHNITTLEQANEFLTKYITKYNSKFAVKPESEVSAFIPLPPKVKLDELLAVKFERSIDNSGTFSIQNNKFQINDKHIPPKSKITILLSKKFGIRAMYQDKAYSVTPLDGLIPTKTITVNSKTVTQYMSQPLIALINEYYLKDAKAS